MIKFERLFAGGLGLITLFAIGTVASATNNMKEPPPVSSEPQQTSASFGDWVVRCDHSANGGAKRVCEAAQSLVVKGQQGPIAQLAFGHAPNDTGNGLTLTVLLPVNVAFDKPPQFSVTDGATADLTYRRCLPGGCLADAKADGSLIRDVRGEQRTGRLIFTDASERSLGLPISFRGLAQALDDLAREASK